jgi:hypothetical protein
MNKLTGSTTFLVGGALVAIAISSAHADPKVRVDKADVDLGACRTFAWQAPSEGAASFTDQRVRAAVMATLKAKGYTEVTEKPDCRVSYVFSSQEVSKRSGPSIGVGVGGGARGIGGGVGIGLPIGRKKQTGTITIDVIDAARNAQIWSGALDGTFKSTELTEVEAKQMVSKVLAKYPNRVGQPSK